MLNAEIANAIGQMSFQEFSCVARANDVWFTIIRMPENIFDYEQTKVNRVIEPFGNAGKVRVTCPITLS